MAEDNKNPLKNLDLYSVPLSQSKNGDYLASRELLKGASNLLAKGELLPKELAAWVSQGLAKLAMGENANSAFNLSRPRGRPGLSEEMEELMAEHIRSSKAGLHKAINSDGSGQGAYAEAAASFGISANSAEKYYKKHIDRILMQEQIMQEIIDENNEG